MSEKKQDIFKKAQEFEKKEEKAILNLTRSSKFKVAFILFILAAIAIGMTYWTIAQSRVYVEKAAVNAPVIALTSSTPGILDKVFVHEGDVVSENMIVAQVGDMPIRAKTSGVVINVLNTPGAVVTSQQAIVQMIDPLELRVVGQVEEDKGLRDIKLGQRVVFTADAYGSKQYSGVVDSISETAHQTDIVFSISDKRALQSYDVKVKYDINAYPELKNGMSAKLWIYK